MSMCEGVMHQGLELVSCTILRAGFGGVEWCGTSAEAAGDLVLKVFAWMRFLTVSEARVRISKFGILPAELGGHTKTRAVHQ